MADKNRLTVKIHGSEYKLISDDSKVYMQSVADYVDDRMNAIAEGNKKLSTAMVAVLTALNIADDYCKQQEELAALKELVTDQVEPIDRAHNRMETLAAQLEKHDDEYQVMTAKFKKLLDHTTDYQRELDALKDKLQILSYELDSKDQALKQSNREIELLQLKLSELSSLQEASTDH